MTYFKRIKRYLSSFGSFLKKLTAKRIDGKNESKYDSGCASCTPLIPLKFASIKSVGRKNKPFLSDDSTDALSLCPVLWSCISIIAQGGKNSRDI